MQRQLSPPSRFNNDNSNNFDNNMAEHYDIENASSIAPSDIDIVYHYKGEFNYKYFFQLLNNLDICFLFCL